MVETYVAVLMTAGLMYDFVEPEGPPIGGLSS